MPTDKLPPFLEEDAQRLRVSWRKSVNYFASFATLWFEVKKRFDNGEFDHRRQELKFGGDIFGAWAAEIGMPAEFVTKLLKVHILALAEEHRHKVNFEIADARRKRREEQEKNRAAREARATKTTKTIKGTTKAAIERVATVRKNTNKKRLDRAEQMSRRGPNHPELRALLEASAYLRQRKPVNRLMLGHCYCDMRSLIEQPEICKGEGKDYDGNPITWGRFVILHIEKSPDSRIRDTRANVEKLERQYVNNLPVGQKPVRLSRSERLMMQMPDQTDAAD